jgi:MoxR-like ATPase
MYGPELTAKDLTKELTWMIEQNYQRPLMIWGAPGLGKTRLTEVVATATGLEHRVFRICDKSPVEINGVPVPKAKVTAWLPPEGLPTSGKGILLLDEIVRAPFVMQGIAQQLIHERRTMSYSLPRGWFIVATGNRKSDKTGSFDMPSDVANRFDHCTLIPDLESTLEYFVREGVAEDIIGFLRFRPELLHRFDEHSLPWPSPRSWFENAWPRLRAGRSVASAVGVAVAAEFKAYVDLKDQLPDLTPILKGQGERVSFPREASQRYAITTALALRAQDALEGTHVLKWLGEKAPSEFLQVATSLVVKTMQAKGLFLELSLAVGSDAAIATSLENVLRLAA